jgi:hypothetical protein
MNVDAGLASAMTYERHLLGTEGNIFNKEYATVA